MPKTPRNGRALLTCTNRTASAPATMPLPRRGVRTSVGYISTPDKQSPTSARRRVPSDPHSPSRRMRRSAQRTEEFLPEPAVDALVRECEQSNKPSSETSALNARVLHAIAAKERRCLELREELAREDALLNDLLKAWKRIAMRGIPAASAEKPVPKANQAGAPPKVQEDMSAVAAATLGSAEPPRGRRASALVSDSWNSIQRQIESHITPLVRVSDEAPPVPPKDEATVRSVASERLASGWSTLSRRLRETAMKLGESTQWIDDAPRSEEELAAMRAALEDPSWRISGIGTPLAAGPGVGALGMIQKWGEEQRRAKALPAAPQDEKPAPDDKHDADQHTTTDECAAGDATTDTNDAATGATASGATDCATNGAASGATGHSAEDGNEPSDPLQAAS